LLVIAAFFSLTGAYKILVVNGGSMEPAIRVGSVIIAKAVDPAKIKVGDIVSFRIPRSNAEQNQSPAIATHRVVQISRERIYRENGSLSFRTKGDANEEPDVQNISAGSLVGKVLIAIPYAGYLVKFAKTLWGFLILIIAPTLVLAISEVSKGRRRRRKRQEFASNQEKAIN
jgi:signal peptidase